MLVKRKLKVAGKSRVFLSHQKWCDVGGQRIFCRSTWEERYAQYLERQKAMGIIQSWEHEPKTFWFSEIKRGTRSYLPDFKVTLPDGSHYWVEVKGYFDSKSLTKIKRFHKYYPQEKLLVVSREWFDK